MFATWRTARLGGRHSDPCPPRHISLCCASLGSAAPRGYCHAPRVGDQTSTRGDLPFAHTTLDWVGPDRVSKRRIPVLMAGDLNAKQTDCNSKLTTVRGSLLRNCSKRNTCLKNGPDSPTTAPYTHSATPDVLDILVVKDFVLPVHLNVWSALSSYHLPILIDTTCRSYFQNLLDRPNFTRMDWAAFQTYLDDRLQGNPVVNEEAIDKCIEKLTSAMCSQVSTPFRPVARSTR
jgi:hypothetical protein